MTMFVDLRDSEWTPLTVPADAWVPLAQAHRLLVDVGKSTVYRWYANDWLDAKQVGPEHGSSVLYVQVVQVRSIYRRIREKRHAAHR